MREQGLGPWAPVALSWLLFAEVAFFGCTPPWVARWLRPDPNTLFQAQRNKHTSVTLPAVAVIRPAVG